MTLIPEQIVGLLNAAGIPGSDLLLWTGVTQLGNDAYQMLARIVQTASPGDLHILNEQLKQKFKLLRAGDIVGWQKLLAEEKNRILNV